MNKKIYGCWLLICSAMVLMLSGVFFKYNEPIPAEAPFLTQQVVEEHKEQLQQETQKRKNIEASQKRAELENKMSRCSEDEQCIIVDKDPCGCLQGPAAVTAINSEYAYEFSKLMDKQFSATTSCPSTASEERECSASATAVCRNNHCKIIY